MTTPILLGQFVSDWMSNWLTPMWLYGLGALLGLAILLGLWAVAGAVGTIPGLQRIGRAAKEAPRTVQEGVLQPLLVTIALVALFGIVGYFIARRPQRILYSLWRLPQVGSETFEDTIPPTPRDELGEPDPARESAFLLEFDREEITRLDIRSTENILIFTTPFDSQRPNRAELDVAAGEPFAWNRTEQKLEEFPEGRVERVYVVNRGVTEADIRITATTRPADPEVRTIPITALCVVVVVLLYFAQSTFFPRLSAVALSTYKSEVAQPLYLILLGIGTVALASFVIIPYYTLGEDIKMLKDNGLTLIMILAMIQAIWAAGTSISEEVEGRTALTVLSKPITRRSFIVGKFLGIVWTVALMFVLLGVWFLIMVAYKPIYDGRENSEDDPTWQVCHLETAETIPGLTLSFMETVVMTSIAVAISTRLPMLANMVICLSIYALGHLTPVLVQSAAANEQFEVVVFIARLIANAFPNLESFNVSPAVAGGVAVPWIYMVYALGYCLVYSLIAMLLALILFEDRDLA